MPVSLNCRIRSASDEISEADKELNQKRRRMLLRLVSCSGEIDHLGGARRTVGDDEGGASAPGCARSKRYADRATRVRGETAAACVRLSKITVGGNCINSQSCRLVVGQNDLLGCACRSDLLGGEAQPGGTDGHRSEAWASKPDNLGAVAGAVGDRDRSVDRAELGGSKDYSNLARTVRRQRSPAIIGLRIISAAGDAGYAQRQALIIGQRDNLRRAARPYILARER